ncbi:MAG: glycerate kinase [Cyclobacteriaceae bacterium]
MKILIAPDKFKGSLTAAQVCDILSSELARLAPDMLIESVPLADGGEGIGDLLTKQSYGRQIDAEVFDPLMRPIVSRFGISKDRKTAFIEMAKASGLQLLDADERDCTVTTTYGTGQLIARALDLHVNHIVLGIGGSATNDAGLGMAEALGFDLLDKEGNNLKGIGANLINLEKISTKNRHPRITSTRFTVLCDVDNPLHGPNGAAYVFAKQKGATVKDVEMLDQGLQNFERVARAMNFNLDFKSAGAAGGLGAGAKLFLNAKIRRGIEFVIDFCRLEDKIKNADLIISGEGRIDTQTLSGKVLHGVATLAKKHDKKLVAVCGQCALTQSQLSSIGIAKVISIRTKGISEIEAIDNAGALLKQRAFQIL